jgi:hypothetical protein
MAASHYHAWVKLLVGYYQKWFIKGAFTPDVKSVLSENLGGILGGT